MSEQIIVAGHVSTGLTAPMLHLAGALAAQGHDVTAIAASRFTDDVPPGVQFAPMRGRADMDDRRLPELFPEYKTQAPGAETLNYNMSTFFVAAMRDQRAQLQELLEQRPQSRLLATATFLGAWPEALGAPGRRPSRWVAVSANPLALSSTDTTLMGPAPISSGHSQTQANVAGNATFQRALSPTQVFLQSELTELGATTVAPPYFDAVVTLADSCAALTVPGFEFARSDAPASLHHVGLIPLKDASSWTPPLWWSELDYDRPVIAVTQGTLANFDLSELIEPTLAALADQPVLVIAALGRDTVGLTAPVPDNARVAEFIPFAALLPRIDVLITNGGFGGTQHAVAAGVPVIVAGASEEKPAVATRVAAHRLGLDLQTGRPAPDQITAAVARVLNDSTYAQNARRLAHTYAEHDAVAEISELLLGDGRRAPATPSTSKPVRALSGRLPFFEDGPLDEDQAALASDLHRLAVPFAQRAGFAGTDDENRLIGPWNILVGRPGPAAGFNAWVLAEQTESSLDPCLREVVMLTVAVARQCAYATYAHTAAARTSGLSEQAITELLKSPDVCPALDDRQKAARHFADQLARRNAVDAEVYEQALAIFGHAGMIDLAHLIGVHLGTCALLEAFAVPSPSGLPAVAASSGERREVPER